MMPWTTADTIVILVFAVIVAPIVWSGFRTSPLSYARWYRRSRGGRWARVSRGWIRVGDEAYGRIDEDWRTSR